QTSQTLFVVDPIDGTKSFLKGEENWGVAAAVVTQGVVEAGVFYMPAKNVTYAARRGHGATKNGVPLSMRAPLAVPDVLTAKASFDPKHWTSGQAPAMERAFRPSLVYRFALVAEGRFDLTMTLRHAWEWDIAAGAILVAEAGGLTLDRHGRELSFNNSDRRVDGAVAGPIELVQETVSALSRA
ncbi:MAG: inositol monophosphatase family protein, partial [Pseudomonadota bacterium]